MKLNGLRYVSIINPIFQYINKSAKYYKSIIKNSITHLIFSIGLLLVGCLNTEGFLEIEGKVIDENTKVLIPGREIIVQGLIRDNNEFVPIDAGQFSTDSSGCFKYSLRKVKDAHYYNFNIVGDSDYFFIKRKLGLFELKQNAKFLVFSLSKLVDLKIKIHSKGITPMYDTMYLSWESNGIDFRTLYPYKIDNYGDPGNFYGLTSYLGIEWRGTDINSTVNTRVFADKMTNVHWVLIQNRRRKEITDTIICKRDLTNTLYFTY